MSLTGHTIGAMLETSMTAMELPALEMGQCAVRMIIEEIELDSNIPSSPKRLVFPAELVEREST